MSEIKLPVCEIFDSIEGEGKRAGELATFIRLVGCNLRCRYCDTDYAFTGGTLMTIPEIMQKVHYRKVTITGGEPLIHDIHPLLAVLKDYEVNIETNGSQPIESYFKYPNVFFTVDFKTYSSGMTKSMEIRNFKRLRKNDVLKFVVGSVIDLMQSYEMYLRYPNLKDKRIYLSPVYGEIEPKQIVKFMQDNKLTKWRIQLQLHKFIWDPQMKGV